jgi:cytochrome P450
MTLYTTVEACAVFPQPSENCPVSELDPYSDEALIDPWAVYGELQRLGSAVWLNKYRMFALTRHDSVLRALKDVSAFSSASGVMMNDDMNHVIRDAVQRWHRSSTRAPLIGKPLLKR